MKNIAKERCFNHSAREAVARCPECSKFFCRECVTEHEDRLLCAICLSKILKTVSARKLKFSFIFNFIKFLVGFILLFVFFYYIGQILLTIPSSFHEGTIWEKGFWQQK